MTNGENLPQVSSVEFQASLRVQRHSQVLPPVAPYTRRLASLPISRKTSRERTQRTQRPERKPRNTRNTRTVNRHSVSSAIDTACRTSNGEHLPRVSSFEFQASKYVEHPFMPFVPFMVQIGLYNDSQTHDSVSGTPSGTPSKSHLSSGAWFCTLTSADTFATIAAPTKSNCETVQTRSEQ